MLRRSVWLAAFVIAELVSYSQAGEADAARIERLERQLESEKFAEREAASKALDTVGEAALPALKKAAGSGDLELRL